MVLGTSVFPLSETSAFQRTPRAELLQNGLVGSPCSPRVQSLSGKNETGLGPFAAVLQCLHGQHGTLCVAAHPLVISLRYLVSSGAGL